MKICVLGAHPMGGDGPKVGTQHIAESLARQGHDVVYVTAQASWAALFFSQQRAKYFSTFRTVRLTNRLAQVTPVKLVPMRVVKYLEGTPLHRAVVWLNSAAERTRDRALEDAEFDLCIFSAAHNITLLPRVRAARYIYRVNDLLSGFSVLPKSVLEFEQQVLASYPISEVCAVNEQIAEHLRASYPHLKIRVIPNGVDLQLFHTAEPDPVLWPSRATNVIYVGAFESWTDVDLVLATARRLPDHTFHLFGNWNRPVPPLLPPNIALHGPIRHQAIAAKMKACSVGLIPSGPQNAGRMVEKPLKFYEYLAAGLGIAATSFAGEGLEPFAVLGDGPDELANAILSAKTVPARYSSDIQETLRGLAWDTLVRQMLESVE
jgi:glycosyltransferase involved in cell wall biosynthesis